MPQFMQALKKSDVPAGAAKTVTLQGQQIAIFNVSGTYYALSNACPHRGGPLAEGDLDDQTVTCPWHGWQFALSTGAALHTAASAKTYPVQIEGEDILVGI